MPVVRVSALPQQATTDVTGLLERLCLRLAEIDEVEPRHWWAIWQPIAPGDYVEGSVAATSSQPRISHPPLVEIQAFTGRDPARVDALLEAAAQILADGLQMEPGNVFITWTELQPGRVLTGGAIRR